MGDTPLACARGSPSFAVSGQMGQSTVEWVGLIALVALRSAPSLARRPAAPGSRSPLRSPSGCLRRTARLPIAGYGSDATAELRPVRHMPALALRERLAGGAGRLPPLSRTACGDAAEQGTVRRTEPACRSPPSSTSSIAGPRRSRKPRPKAPTAPAPGPATSTSSTGSTTRTRPPCAVSRSPATRVTTATTGRASRSASGPTGSVDERATSHNGYNDGQGDGQLGSDARDRPGSRTRPKPSASAPRNGWGPEPHGLLLVSGGSHAGNAQRHPHADRLDARQPRPPDPARAIAATSAARLRDQPALAQAGLVRSGVRAEPTERLPGRYRTERSARLLRRHPQGAVEPDRLAVEHRVGDDLADQLGVLLGPAEPRGERDAGAERPARAPRAARRAAACRRGRGRS